MNEYERVEKILCHPFGSNNSFQLLSLSHSILFITVTLFSILWFQLFRVFKGTFIFHQLLSDSSTIWLLNCIHFFHFLLSSLSFHFFSFSVFFFLSFFLSLSLSVSLTSSKKMIQIYVQFTVWIGMKWTLCYFFWFPLLIIQGNTSKVFWMMIHERTKQKTVKRKEREETNWKERNGKWRERKKKILLPWLLFNHELQVKLIFQSFILPSLLPFSSSFLFSLSLFSPSLFIPFSLLSIAILFSPFIHQVMT